MIRLFKYENYEVVVSPEALKLSPFKKIWERDKSKGKDKAQMELAYIYFFADPRSDYQYIVNDDDRSEAIARSEGLPASWKPDKLLKDAVSFYSTFLPESALLLQDTRLVVSKLREKLRDTEISDMKDIKEISNILKVLPELIEKLNKTEKMVFEQIHETEARGSMEKTLFDDGLDGV